MAILNTGTKTDAAAEGNRWAGRVRAGAIVPPWWSSNSIVAVAEVEIAGVLSLLVHVGRSKSGKMFANLPSSKKGDEWIAMVEITDPALAAEVQRCATHAVEEALLRAAPAVAGAAHVAEVDDDSMPF